MLLLAGPYDSNSKLSQADSCGNILYANDIDHREEFLRQKSNDFEEGSFEKQQARLEEALQAIWQTQVH